MMSLEERGRKQVDSILSMDDIDWAGNKSHLRPMPRVDIKACEDIRRRLEELDKTKIPAPKMALAGMLYKLQGHYWQPNMSEELAKSVADDYVRLLDGVTLDVMQRGCDRWLLDKDNKFFPKIGELQELLKGIQQRKQWYESRLRMLIAKYHEDYKNID